MTLWGARGARRVQVVVLVVVVVVVVVVEVEVVMVVVVLAGDRHTKWHEDGAAGGRTPCSRKVGLSLGLPPAAGR